MDHYRAIVNLEHRFLEALDESDFDSVASLFGDELLEITVPGRPEPVKASGRRQISSMLSGVIPALHPKESSDGTSRAI